MGTPIGFSLIKPNDGDDSSQWDDYIEALFDWAVTHTHDGVNSPVSVIPVTKPFQTILSTSWTDLLNSRYSAILTLPSGRNISNTEMKFINTIDNSEVNPTVNGNILNPRDRKSVV